MLCPEDYRSAQSPHSAPNSVTLMRLALVVCLALLQPPGLEAKSWKSCPADGSKDCTKAGCCETPGYKCYQKSKYWASCKASCTPGIDPNDPPKYQQPWDCTVIGGGGGGGSSPAPAPYPAPSPSPSPPKKRDGRRRAPRRRAKSGRRRTPRRRAGSGRRRTPRRRKGSSRRRRRGSSPRPPP